MRLTVGPLPAAVYWRRRAVILVGIAMIVLVVAYACGGPQAATNNAGPSPTGSTEASTPAVPGPASADPASGTSSGPAPTPTASAFSLPLPATTGPCTDAEMEIVASAGAAEVTRGQPVTFTIKIKNVSARTCNRDIGANAQELRLQDDKVIIWSSDDCGANQGTDDRSLEPGQEVSFTRTWNGMRSRGGDGTAVCDSPAPEPKEYQLIARLDQKLSAAFTVRVRAEV